MDGFTACQRAAPCRWCRDFQQVTGIEPKRRGPHGPLLICVARCESVDAAQQGIDTDLGAGLGIHLLDDDGTVQAVGATLGG